MPEFDAVKFYKKGLSQSEVPIRKKNPYALAHMHVYLYIFMPLEQQWDSKTCEIRLGENKKQILYTLANNLHLCTSIPVSCLSLGPLCNRVYNKTGT